MEYIIYCDESSSEGVKFSDFFGGCIISSKDLRSVTEALEDKKRELNLNGEIKWTKVTAQYLDRYIQVMDLFFDYVKEGKVKVRIMFRKNEDMPSDFRERRSDDKYFKLYYQFLKNAFGLKEKFGGVRRGVRASGSYQEGTGKSGSYGMWNHPRGHVWNVFVRPASS